MYLPDYNKRARMMSIMQSRWKEKQGQLNMVRDFIKGEVTSVQFYSTDTVICIRDGRKFYWQPERFHSLGTLIRDGMLEPEEYNTVRKLLLPKSTAIDIGAHFGWYTTLLSQLTGSGGMVIGFEPLPDLYEQLQKNIELNGMSNVIAEPCAISDYTGTTMLGYPEILGPEYASIGDYEETMGEEFALISCKVLSLDHYLKESDLERIDFIKIDVEGNEMGVLKGARETLLLHKPTLMIEVFEDQLKKFGCSAEMIYHYLTELGYRVYSAGMIEISSPEELQQLTSRNIFGIHPY